MPHAIYQTPAVILKTKNMRESNKLLVLYTERFGLIYASTQSVRELKSKMRFHTNTFSLVNVDLVRGRDIWKLTGIHEDYSALKIAGSGWYALLTKIGSVLRRLCNGEDPHQEVWEDLRALYDLIQQGEQPDLDDLEIVFVTRLLYHLGYWQHEDPVTTAATAFSEETYREVRDRRSYYIKGINTGIQSSQL